MMMVEFEPYIIKRLNDVLISVIDNIANGTISNAIIVATGCSLVSVFYNISQVNI